MRIITGRAISIRAVAFLLTLIAALGLTLCRRIYVERQALFAGAAWMGRPLRMKMLYKLGVDVNAPGCEYRSCFYPIWGAAYGGYDDEILFLLDRGADVNAKRQIGSGTTALMMAAYNGHESTVRLLLSKGADANVVWDGITALTLARDKHHPEIVELLRQAGARDTP
jgi:hypothetical protein